MQYDHPCNNLPKLICNMKVPTTFNDQQGRVLKTKNSTMAPTHNLLKYLENLSSLLILASATRKVVY